MVSESFGITDSGSLTVVRDTTMTLIKSVTTTLGHADAVPAFECSLRQSYGYPCTAFDVILPAVIIIIVVWFFYKRHKKRTNNNLNQGVRNENNL